MTVNDKAKFDGTVSPVANEQGMAIIIVMIMLLMLSILGMTMFASTTADLQIAANFRNNLEAFYTAEAAVEFGESFDSIYTQIIPQTATSWPLAGQGTNLDSNFRPTSSKNPTGHLDYNHIQIAGTKNSADVKVELTNSGVLPPGSGSQEDAGNGGTAFKANYYAISVIAYGPNSTTAQIESSIARVIPNN
jgi:Tfp pilus assembly protein PilX